MELRISIEFSKNLNLKRSIISQNINDNRGSKNFTSTDNERRNLIEYSNTLQGTRRR